MHVFFYLCIFVLNTILQAICLYNVKVNQTMRVFREPKEYYFVLKTKGTFGGNTLNTNVGACGRQTYLLHITGRKKNTPKSSMKAELAC